MFPRTEVDLQIDWTPFSIGYLAVDKKTAMSTAGFESLTGPGTPCLRYISGRHLCRNTFLIYRLSACSSPTGFVANGLPGQLSAGMDTELYSREGTKENQRARAVC